MAETLTFRGTLGTAGNRRTPVRVTAPTARDHQAEAPEIAPAGRGVSRTTGTQKAGWLRMRGRAGIFLEEAAALAGGPDAIGGDGAGGGVLHAGGVHGTYFLATCRASHGGGWRPDVRLTALEGADVPHQQRGQRERRDDRRRGEHRRACPSAAATGPTARTRAASPAVVNQSSEVTRESDAGGISRPSVVSHSVKPALTPIPASSSNAAIAAVEPAKPMMIGWHAARQEARRADEHRPLGAQPQRSDGADDRPDAEAGHDHGPARRRRRARGRRSRGRARARRAARSGGRRSARA